MKLREYQARALDDLWAWFASHSEGHPIVNACVGAGKSVMIAALCQRAIKEYPGTRIVVLVDKKELLAQNIAKLLKVWPGAIVGVYSAAFRRKELGRQITFATIASIYKDAHRLGRVDLVLADECHAISTKGEGMWRRFLKELSTYSPGVRVVGWTGTDFRGNGVFLTDGKDPLFTHVATRVTMRELLDLGYLTPLVPATTRTRINTDDVSVVGNDYVIRDLAEASDKEELVRAACKEMVELSTGRRRCMAFGVTVKHAQHIRDELVRLGESAEVVTDETPGAERDAKVSAFRRGVFRWLVNVGVFTTGFDVPEVDFIALLRATRSPVIYVQIPGRGMRCVGANIEESIANGKENCSWADFTDTTERMGPVDLIKGRPAAAGRSGEAPVKICPDCGNPNPTAATNCTYCGFRFPEPERVKHRQSASGAAVLSDQGAQLESVPVKWVRYHLHAKPDSPDSLRVEYMGGGPFAIAKEWICFSHHGMARWRAEQWWRDRATIDEIPTSTQAALEWIDYDKKILREPTEIIINTREKYPVVEGYKWE